MKKKPKRKPKSVPLPLRVQVRVLQLYIKRLDEELLYVEKSRNALAKLVDPFVMTRVHLLEDRNKNLERAIVLTRQMAKLIRHSWTEQGYPIDMVEIFEAELKSILGD